ncbi:hypothetical protein I317_03460 [Kwoniella heveanensis CBS 569]|nr:hypothetical protein I317_03460 [Kwoniella heveanensis CBS 569]
MSNNEIPPSPRNTPPPSNPADQGPNAPSAAGSHQFFASTAGSLLSANRSGGGGASATTEAYLQSLRQTRTDIQSST